MANDDVSISIRLRGAQKFAADSAKSALALKGIGSAADDASRAARAMGGAFSSAANVTSRAMGAAASSARTLALGVGLVGAAGVKMGLSFNAQIESARLRFSLFTNDVDGLTAAVQKIDMTSAFGLADLSDAAAMFGNSGVQDIPKVLQGAANAAAASGKGVQSLNSIAIALSQIQSKGRLSQEEINQLNEAGAPGAQRIIAEHFKLTAKELQNLGGQGLDAKEAIDALTREWTSGKMAKAAEAQTKTLGGQWNLLTGNVQKLSGAATESLAAGLRDTALPAINDATQKITEIFGREGLSNEQKIAAARKVIVRELGPVWNEIGDEISEADIPGKLGDVIRASAPKIADAAVDVGGEAAKAFVDAWMHSGPWVQFLSAAVIANKIRKSDFGSALFSKGGGKGGEALGKALGARGATPANPVFVSVVGGGLPGDVPGGPLKKGGKLATIGKNVARVAGPVGVAVGGAEVFRAVAPNVWKNDYETGGAAAQRQASRQLPAPGFGGGMPGVNVNATFNVDGKTVSRATATTDTIERNRANAVRAASR